MLGSNEGTAGSDAGSVLDAHDDFGGGDVVGEVYPGDESVVEAGPLKVMVPEVDSPQICPHEVGTLNHHPAEIDRSKVCSSQAGVRKVNGLKVLDGLVKFVDLVGVQVVKRVDLFGEFESAKLVFF